jgi:large subunit ribosomal protein L1
MSSAHARNICSPTLQAVEVAKPDATYEIVIKTAMSKGTTIPKGRVNLPREAKPKQEDKILVFATGQLAQEAKDAGADIVGGEELIEGVRSVPSILNAQFLFKYLADHKR